MTTSLRVRNGCLALVQTIIYPTLYSAALRTYDEKCVTACIAWSRRTRARNWEPCATGDSWKTRKKRRSMVIMTRSGVARAVRERQVALGESAANDGVDSLDDFSAEPPEVVAAEQLFKP